MKTRKNFLSNKKQSKIPIIGEKRDPLALDFLRTAYAVRGWIECRRRVLVFIRSSFCEEWTASPFVEIMSYIDGNEEYFVLSQELQ
jgi:hypothetical protein